MPKIFLVEKGLLFYQIVPLISFGIVDNYFSIFSCFGMLPFIYSLILKIDLLSIKLIFSYKLCGVLLLC